MTKGMCQHAPGFPSVSIALHIDFPLLAIVPAPAAFLSPSQRLAL
jgi:hypothetical protein